MSGEFVDTNVLLYAYDPSAGERHALALELVSRLGRERQGTLSIQVLQEFYVNAVRKIAKPLKPQSAENFVRRLLVRKPLAITSELLLAGAALSRRYHMSYWDSAIVAAAMVLGCDTLYTEDLQHGQRFAGVRIINPFL